MVELPPISDPRKYEGLFVYDFGDHVSVGYTAAEIRVLRAAGPYRKGAAYQIYRVNEQGGMELRGVSDADLSGNEALCFLRSSGEAARADYDLLARAAYAHPLPCQADLLLIRSSAFRPPDVTALIYPSWAGHAIAQWLGQWGARLGDTVRGGQDAYQALQSGDGLTISTRKLPAAAGFADRPQQEVLATTELALQR